MGPAAHLSSTYSCENIWSSSLCSESRSKSGTEADFQHSGKDKWKTSCLKKQQNGADKTPR